MNFLLNRWHNGVKPRVLVIGDLILDRYIWGEIERISPEAPVQILAWEKESSALGGAANVANNLAQLGCNVYLSGIIGYDSEGDELLKKAKQFNINTSLILKTKKLKITIIIFPQCVTDHHLQTILRSSQILKT